MVILDGEGYQGKQPPKTAMNYISGQNMDLNKKELH
jgi:hypothetical protein